MSRKGVSAEEKRTRMLNVFHETCEVYQLKDLEKVGPKRGVPAQSVKDVVQSLVDDDLVVTDKIGTSNYYWSFPSASTQIKRNKIEDLQKIITQEEHLSEQLEKATKAEEQGREPSEEREALLAELKQACDIQKDLEQQLKKFKVADLANFELKEKAAEVAKQATNRWTENVWALQSYCINKLGMDRQQFNTAFSITDDFDTI